MGTYRAFSACSVLLFGQPAVGSHLGIFISPAAAALPVPPVPACRGACRGVGGSALEKPVVPPSKMIKLISLIILIILTKQRTYLITLPNRSPSPGLSSLH
jgi:hypothetical protein